MDISYKRTHMQSFMVVRGGDSASEFEMRMLTENRISSLLDFQTSVSNGDIQYMYDITGLLSLEDYLMREEITLDFLLRIILHMILSFNEISKYLIDASNISLKPSMVYIKRTDDFRLFFCYMPTSDEDTSLEDVLRIVIEQVSGEDDEFIKLCYELYERSMLKSCTMQELYDRLLELKSRRSEVPEVSKVEISTYTSDAYTQENSTVSYSADKIENSVRSKLNNDIDYDDIYMEDEGVISSTISMIKKGLSGFSKRGSDKDNIVDELVKEKRGLFGRKKDRPKVSIMPSKKKEKRYHDLIVEPDEEEDREVTVLLSSRSKCEGRFLHQGNKSENNFAVGSSGKCIIGSRKGKADIRLDSAAISREHAMVSINGGEYYIEDLNSTNGTLVNGVILDYKQSVKLNPMDSVAFADEVYIFI